MKKIKVQSRISPFIFILGFIVILAIVIFVAKFIIFDNSLSYRTKSNGWELIFALIFFVPFLFGSLTNNQEYTSHILISDDSLYLVYKIKNKITKTKIIALNEIEKFEIEADLNTVYYSRSSYLKAKITTKISLLNNEIITFKNNENEIEFFRCPYQYVLDILNISSMLPNFSLQLKGNDRLAIENINYYKRFGKKLPFWFAIKYQFNSLPKSSKIIFFICTLFLIIPICMILYLNAPSLPLTKAEKEYYQIYINALEDYKNKDYTKAIQKYDAAQRIINTSSDSYLQKAYCYKKINKCTYSIKEAKEGLKYTNKQPIYYKANNYKFQRNDKIALYDLIGECSLKIKNYKEAIEAYTYIIDNSKYRYTDAYFNRGQAYYYLRQFNLAKSDFLKHKEIIKGCIEEEYCSRYEAKHLKNINLWLDACNYYSNH